LDFIEIQDINNSSLEIYRTLRDNILSKDNSFIADSPKVVNKLLSTDLHVKSILATKEYYDEFKELISSKKIPKLYLADKAQMQKIVGHKIHHNVMMHGIRPKESSLKNLGKNIIMLDILSSTQNVGSIARSAAALGVDSYVLSAQSPHPYSRRALRVSMGYISDLKVHVYEDIFFTIKELKRNGYKIFAAEITANSTPLLKVDAVEKWVLLMGKEGEGILQEILNACDEVVHIEMQEGVKSFNVAVASSILMYQLKNKRCKYGW
jgi:tRNA G18 (ribose-2'-O)-methylase SpoU